MPGPLLSVGTIAITDYGWYESLRTRPDLSEVNFWKPSAARRFNAAEFSPFFFKLKAPKNAICGFAFFARYSALPEWLAWDTFGPANGVGSFSELRSRIRAIRDRISFTGDRETAPIGCILLVQPMFFEESEFVAAPSDWRVRTQSSAQYDLDSGEGARVYRECLERVSARSLASLDHGLPAVVGPEGPRYGAPRLIQPRLGQKTFRIAVTDAYGRACAMSGEHSLPALEAAHIHSYRDGGPHEVSNGLLLRADIHRLFDKGYITVGADRRIEVSPRLKQDFENGRSYYPYHGQRTALPPAAVEHPSEAALAWHREHRYLT